MQFFHISNRTMCFSKKIFYQNFFCFFALLGTGSPLKTFDSTKIALKTTPDYLNYESEITDINF